MPSKLKVDEIEVASASTVKLNSTLAVDTIKDASATNTLVEQSGSDWKWGSSVPAGTVLQVVSTQSNSMAAYTNTMSSTTPTWQDLLSLDITPTATSSKVLVSTSIACGVDTYSVSFRILQAGSTVSDHLGASSSRTPTTFGAVPYASNDDEFVTVSYTGLFSPSSTSAVTYKVQGVARASNWSFNRCEDTNDSYDRANAVSSITLMEIKA